MKKLFFSAVALIAFSSVSMANTIEVEYKVDDCCMYSAADQLTWLDPNNELSGAEANGLYQFLYQFCIETGGGDLYSGRGNM